MTGRDARPLLEDVAADADLRQAVALIATLGDEPAPRPSAALADLLDRGFEPTVLPFRRPAGQGRRWAARTGAGLVAAAASVVVAGTAAALPAPVQDTVADLVSALSPFELPRPPADDDRDAPPGPADDPVAPQAPPATTTPTRSAPVSTGPAARTTADPGRPDDAPDDAASPDRQQRDQERADEDAAEARDEAAEESEEAAEDAADDAADQADEEAEEAARDTDPERPDD